ncbi:odorant receptor 131-2-like [Astyanax mexicanus]|uniref:odorant receptor 131-2-like n=1 Tax=Astyanax mexicanus TaxID=7994 RepID=UPI0020CADFF8|nr:odorant receptor 131-2-like [Astyanax mexicanus]
MILVFIFCGIIVFSCSVFFLDMCTAECNSSWNESSFDLLDLDSSALLRMNIGLTLTQMFVWPFLLINILMLFTFYRKQAFRTETRYILFAHTLLTDVIFLLLTDLQVILKYNVVQMPVSFCIPLCILIEVVNTCTPLTITAMCVERYVAICMPLRHSAISTTSRTINVILIIWIMSFIVPFMDVLILIVSVPEEYFIEPIFCHYDIMMPEHWHRAMRSILYVIDFFIILLIEFFCYLMIMIAARRASVDKKSAAKGLRTVSLHMIQLILCTVQSVCPYVEAEIIEIDFTLYLSVRLFNFLTFNIIARAITPLVYGIRDETFCAALLHYIKCRQNHISSEKKEPNF